MSEIDSSMSRTTIYVAIRDGDRKQCMHDIVGNIQYLEATIVGYGRDIERCMRQCQSEHRHIVSEAADDLEKTLMLRDICRGNLAKMLLALRDIKAFDAKDKVSIADRQNQISEILERNGYCQ